jgi:hypothetical protein
MPLSRSLLHCLFIIAVGPAFSEEPAPKPLSEPVPIAPVPPVKAPAAAPDQVLPREDSAIRPGGRPSLLPDEIPAVPRQPVPPVGMKEKLSTPLASTASALDLRIRYQKARNIAEANEKVRAAWGESRSAKTDHGKRQALIRYRNALYATMLAIDKGIAPLVEQRRKAQNHLLEQTHIAPTVPLE